MSDLSFRIEASSKAFEILASNLYSDKIAAVIRELSCNAADAHVEANKSTTPFYVQLPTSYTPQFIVRDYGNGLRADQIEDVFTVFFSSTKLGSKAYTGAFGLGCKSPFAVTNRFFVNSYIDGKMHSYECFRNSENVPCIKFIKEIPTNESSGLEIIVPVVKDSYNEWMNKAAKIYESFKIRPKTNFNLEYFSKSQAYKYGNNWENTNSSGTWVCMNNVRYKLDSSKIHDCLRNPGSQFKSKGICYIVPPRSIEVTPSREEVSYTENTINFLNNFINQVHEDIKKNFQEMIENCPSMFMAKIKFSHIQKDYYDEYINFDNIINPSIYSWSGTPISAHKDISLSIKYSENIEIGYLFNASRHASSKKENLRTNMNFRFPSSPNCNNFVILINDTKASQESIKSWMNRKMKASSINAILFLVIKSEYAFIIKDINKIDNKYITTCSKQGLQKITRASSSRSRSLSKNVLLHNFCIHSSSIKSNNQNPVNDEEDIMDDLTDENGNIYFIEYEHMIYESIDGVYLDDAKSINLGNIARKFLAFEKINNNLESRFVNKVKNVLLIKNLKKNKEFMRKYVKDNKVRFVPYRTVFLNHIENHLENNPEYTEALIRCFAMFFWENKYSFGFSDSFNLFDKDENFENMFNTFKKVANRIEEYEDVSKELSIICQSYRHYKKDVDEKTIVHIIDYIVQSICLNNHVKFIGMLTRYSRLTLEFVKAFESFCAKIPVFFMTQEEKEKKIIEYYVTGKMS